MEEQPPIWKVVVNILIQQLQTADKGWTPDRGLGEVLITPHHKNVSCHEMFTPKVMDFD